MVRSGFTSARVLLIRDGLRKLSMLGRFRASRLGSYYREEMSAQR